MKSRKNHLDQAKMKQINRLIGIWKTYRNQFKVLENYQIKKQEITQIKVKEKIQI